MTILIIFRINYQTAKALTKQIMKMFFSKSKMIMISSRKARTILKSFAASFIRKCL
jgi:hypothetical protein